jgi:hypothetical protein
MRKRHFGRLLVLVAAIGATLILAAGALGAFSPSFTVSTDASGITTIAYQQASGDDAAGALTFYVPADVFANVSQPPGLAVGKASGTIAGQATPLTGTVAAADPTNTVPGGTATLATAAPTCSGTAGAPAAFWMISLTGGGQTLQLPAYVYNVLETDPYGSFFIAKIAICPSAATKLVNLTILPSEVFSITPGWDVWHLNAVPYAAGGTSLNTGGAVEAEAQDRTPHEVTVSAKRGKAGGTVTVSGKVKQGGKGLVGIPVNVLAGKKVVASGKTTAGGSFKIVAKTSAKSLVAQATVPDRKLPSCVQPLFVPAQCVSATISGFVVKSDPAHVQ